MILTPIKEEEAFASHRIKTHRQRLRYLKNSKHHRQLRASDKKKPPREEINQRHLGTQRTSRQRLQQLRRTLRAANRPEPPPDQTLKTIGATTSSTNKPTPPTHQRPQARQQMDSPFSHSPQGPRGGQCSNSAKSQTGHPRDRRDYRRYQKSPFPQSGSSQRIQIRLQSNQRQAQQAPRLIDHPAAHQNFDRPIKTIHTLIGTNAKPWT